VRNNCFLARIGLNLLGTAVWSTCFTRPNGSLPKRAVCDTCQSQLVGSRQYKIAADSAACIRICKISRSSANDAIDQPSVFRGFRGSNFPERSISVSLVPKVRSKETLSDSPTDLLPCESPPPVVFDSNNVGDHDFNPYGSC
jgi:hypothetical protein